jgi:hypothetical protein
VYGYGGAAYCVEPAGYGRWCNVYPSGFPVLDRLRLRISRVESAASPAPTGSLKSAAPSAVTGFLRMLPWRPRVSQHSRASACDSRGARKRASRGFLRVGPGLDDKAPLHIRWPVFRKVTVHDVVSRSRLHIAVRRSKCSVIQHGLDRS